MSQEQKQEQVNSAEPPQTPLEFVREQQSVEQQNQDIENHPDPTPEVPGASIPSDRRHHPQRQNR